MVEFCPTHSEGALRLTNILKLKGSILIDWPQTGQMGRERSLSWLVFLPFCFLFYPPGRREEVKTVLPELNEHFLTNSALCQRASVSAFEMPSSASPIPANICCSSASDTLLTLFFFLLWGSIVNKFTGQIWHNIWNSSWVPRMGLVGWGTWQRGCSLTGGRRQHTQCKYLHMQI